MKLTAQDLQIGDYFDYRGNTIKVTSIYAKNGSGEVGFGNKPDCWVHIDVIKPIPITPEILENNGFEYQEGWEEWWHKCEDGFGSDFQLSITEDGFSMKDTIDAQINYVHQLQQAMRLCNIKGKEIKL